MTKMTIYSKPKAIFLMGPTASGKTELAMKLYQHLPVSIISVDSALIYRGMDIGTAKPKSDELKRAPHRLIDIRDPTESYSVADFYHDALKEMKKITKIGHIPLLVGGSIFYFKALLEGLSPLPASDPEVRAYIECKAKTFGWYTLHKQLQKIDVIAANRIHPNDSRRLLRALEVFFISGKTLTELINIPGKTLAYHVYKFAIAPRDRNLLHQRIAQRFYQMLASGFEYEVSMLFARGDLCKEMPSIRCVGYRQMWLYISDKTNYNDMVFQGISATKQLAKRQMTWLHGWDDLYWLDSDRPIAAINKILQVVNA